MAPSTLQVLTKAIQRLEKEGNLYKNDIAEQEREMETLINNNADEVLIRKHREVLDESKRMIPELNRKLSDHKNRLRVFLQSYSGDEDVQAATSLIN